MKKEYVRPELYKEEFCLSEHVAKGCGSKIEITPGSSVTVDRVCCSQLLGKEPGTNQGGQGHWDFTNVTLYDDNGNGNIDWAEIVKYVGHAQNGVETGGGHNHHEINIVIPGKEVITVIPENS